MVARRSLLAAALGALTLAGSATFALAADKMAYTAQAFESAQKAGKPILVEITAPWCPTCKAQKPILSELFVQPRFKDLAVFEVDFDNQGDVVKSFGARMQSTLIAFQGKKEVARSVGDTDATSIKGLLDKSI